MNNKVKTAVTAKTASATKKSSPAKKSTAVKKSVRVNAVKLVKKPEPAKSAEAKKSAAAKKTTVDKKQSEAQKVKLNQNPTLTATVEFNSRRNGKLVARTFEVSKADINDVDWFGGNCGDYFYDNEFENDEDRFEERLRDWIHFLLWEGESEGKPLDPELNGKHRSGLSYHDRLNDVFWKSDFVVEDFYPPKKTGATKAPIQFFTLNLKK